MKFAFNIQNSFYILFKEKIAKFNRHFSDFLKKKFSDFNSSYRIYFDLDSQKTDLSSTELSKFFEKEDWQKSFLDYPYFHHSSDSSDTKPGGKLKLNKTGRQAYLSENRYFLVWKLRREIYPTENGKSEFRETWELESLNLLSKFLIKLFPNILERKILEFSRERIRTIQSSISSLSHFPQKIHFHKFSRSANFFVDTAIQNVFILPFLSEWKILKKYFPKNFTPRFHGQKILLYCVYYQIRSIQKKFSDGREYTEFFQSKFPEKSDIYADCFPYSDEKIVGLNSLPIKFGSIYQQKELLKKEIEWNFSPTEIQELFVKIDVKKQSIT
ncbi:MAG: hypothetical protein IT569_04395, partial [Leptospiraceae bacterium]|nr:hypothetical protein [Leptospiraceae bacterium]